MLNTLASHNTKKYEVTEVGVKDTFKIVSFATSMSYTEFENRHTPITEKFKATFKTVILHYFWTFKVNICMIHIHIANQLEPDYNVPELNIVLCTY